MLAKHAINVTAALLFEYMEKYWVIGFRKERKHHFFSSEVSE